MNAASLKGVALTPILRTHNGAVFTNSRDVASFFGKQHGHVLHDIEALQEHLSLQIWRVWFRASTADQKTGFGVRKVPTFDMTKDGFAVLAFTPTASGH